MSVLLNFGPARSQPASSARLQIMIDEKRGKQRGEVGNRIPESSLRDEVAVREIDAQRGSYEYPSQRDRGTARQPATQPQHVRQQAHGKDDQRVEQDVETRVVLAVGPRRHGPAR